MLNHRTFRRLCPALLAGLTLCGPATLNAQESSPAKLPKPYATESAIHHPKVIGWPEGKKPTAPDGFEVTHYASLESPRWIYVLPNGDCLIAQARTLPKKKSEEDEEKPYDEAAEKAKEASEKSEKEKEKQQEGMKKSKTVTGTSPNRITLLRDEDSDGKPELIESFHAGLNQPFGMALVDDTLFIAATDALWAFDYEKGQTALKGPGEKIIDLPAGGYNNHWTRNVVASKDGKKLYVSVGSASNVAEHGTAEEMLRANVLELNLDGTGLRVFASGIRNPVGMAWNPGASKDKPELWVAVNERDELGDDLVPDYLAHAKEDGFYGWPYSYWGDHVDPRWKDQREDLVKQAIRPDVNLGSHTASLGLAFYTGKSFPEKYHQAAFVGQRGSWNRSKFVGYKVVMVPFEDGKPAGEPQDFLTGFIANESEVYGRPVGVAVDKDGALLVADEPANTVWRVAYKKK